MDLRAIISRPNLSISLAKSGILWSFSWLIGDYILLLENDATLYLRDDIYRGIYIGKKFPFRKFFYFFFFFLSTKSISIDQWLFEMIRRNRASSLIFNEFKISAIFNNYYYRL